MSENVPALCDVNDEYAARAFSRFPKANKYKDYRVMLDKMGRDIDAVCISTPDHMHYPITVAAMELGNRLKPERFA